jgi:diacylglycerol kinase family enzyme
MKNISVYFNKMASNGSKDWKVQITNALIQNNIIFQAPSNLDELNQKLEVDVANNVDAVLAVGGDGTVNTIIQRLAGTDIGLFAVPGGTANDFARVMGYNADIGTIAQILKQNLKKKIDLICINGQYMVTNGGLGLAADVATEINDLRGTYPIFNKIMQLSGKSIYALFLAKRLLNWNIKTYKFKINSKEFSDTILTPMLLVNNQPCVGGNFKVAPDTDHMDGKMNITIFKHQNRFQLIICILKIFTGNYPYNDKFLVSFETEAAQVDLFGDNITFFGDGEIFNQSKNWDIKCHANFLSVFSPKNRIDMVN